MNTNLKNGLMLGATLVTIACVIFGTIYHVGGFMVNAGRYVGMFSPLRITGSFEDYEDNATLGQIDSISLDVNLGNLTIESGSSNKIEISASDDRLAPKYEVKNGTLSIFGQSEKVTMPTDPSVDITITVADKLSSIKGEMDLGDLEIRGITADVIDITLDLGDLTVADCKARDVFLTENLGDVEVKNVDFDSIKVKEDLGSVSIKVPGSASEYNVDLKVDLGEIDCFGDEYGEKYKAGSGSKSIVVTNSLGDIEIK